MYGWKYLGNSFAEIFYNIRELLSYHKICELCNFKTQHCSAMSRFLFPFFVCAMTASRKKKKTVRANTLSIFPVPSSIAVRKSGYFSAMKCYLRDLYQKTLARESKYFDQLTYFRTRTFFISLEIEQKCVVKFSKPSNFNVFFPFLSRTKAFRSYNLD